MPLHIMRLAFEAAGSGHVPCVVDLRAGLVHRIPPRGEDRRVRSFVTTEAEAFLRYWELAAAS